MHLAVGILRVPGGCDYSNIIQEEGQMTIEQLTSKIQKPIPRNKSEGQLSQGMRFNFFLAINVGAIMALKYLKNIAPIRLLIRFVLRNTEKILVYNY